MHCTTCTLHNFSLHRSFYNLYTTQFQSTLYTTQPGHYTISVYTVHYTTCTLHNFSLHCTLHNVYTTQFQSTLYTTQPIHYTISVYTVHFTTCTLHNFSLHCSLHNLYTTQFQSTLYTTQPIHNTISVYTVHYTTYTLHYFSLQRMLTWYRVMCLMMRMTSCLVMMTVMMTRWPLTLNTKLRAKLKQQNLCYLTTMMMQVVPDKKGLQLLSFIFFHPKLLQR